VSHEDTNVVGVAIGLHPRRTACHHSPSYCGSKHAGEGLSTAGIASLPTANSTHSPVRDAELSVARATEGRFWGAQVGQQAPTEPLAIIYGDVANKSEVSVRVHDACFTSEVLGSMKCDCAEQLNYALDYIKEHDGIVVYLQQV